MLQNVNLLSEGNEAKENFNPIAYSDLSLEVMEDLLKIDSLLSLSVSIEENLALSKDLDAKSLYVAMEGYRSKLNIFGIKTPEISLEDFNEQTISNVSLEEQEGMIKKIVKVIKDFIKMIVKKVKELWNNAVLFFDDSEKRATNLIDKVIPKWEEKNGKDKSLILSDINYEETYRFINNMRTFTMTTSSGSVNLDALYDLFDDFAKVLVNSLNNYLMIDENNDIILNKDLGTDIMGTYTGKSLKELGFKGDISTDKAYYILQFASKNPLVMELPMSASDIDLAEEIVFLNLETKEIKPKESDISINIMRSICTFIKGIKTDGIKKNNAEFLSNIEKLEKAIDEIAKSKENVSPIIKKKQMELRAMMRYHFTISRDFLSVSSSTLNFFESLMKRDNVF